jgi:CDP-paratose 2-epimerase
MLEAIEKAEEILGKKAKVKYMKTNRVGDHIWYISDVSKFESHYPLWKYTYDNDAIIKEIATSGHF